jgi:hypothetical protein
MALEDGKSLTVPDRIQFAKESCESKEVESRAALVFGVKGVRFRV